MNQKPMTILIGASAGGVAALQRLFSGFSGGMGLPIIVVQHLPSDSIVQPALVFGHTVNSFIEEAIDKMPIEKGHIYFAPPGYHLLVEKDHTFSLSQDDEVHFSRPSIDVLFESAALAFGREACGVLLTGANSDGAAGLKVLHEHGGLTLVQEPQDAEVSTMPQAALELFKPDFVGSIEAISKTLSAIARGESW